MPAVDADRSDSEQGAGPVNRHDPPGTPGKIGAPINDRFSLPDSPLERTVHAETAQDEEADDSGMLPPGWPSELNERVVKPLQPTMEPRLDPSVPREVGP